MGCPTPGSVHGDYARIRPQHSAKSGIEKGKGEVYGSDSNNSNNSRATYPYMY